MVLFVVFPAGWERRENGWYETAEEVVICDGTLEMSGLVLEPGDWAYAPARWFRYGMRARGEVSAFARFEGPARWVAGEQDEGLTALHGRLEPDGEPQDSPLGEGKAWLLRRGDADAAWLVDGDPPGRSAPIRTELFDLQSRAWAMIPAGGTLPGFGRSFCRTYTA